MRKSRFSEEQIAYALRQVEQGTPATELCRKLGISEQTFYPWKKKYAGMGVLELKRVKQLEEENQRLPMPMLGRPDGPHGSRPPWMSCERSRGPHRDLRTWGLSTQRYSGCVPPRCR